MNRFSFAEPRPASKQGSQWRPYSQRRTGYNIRRGINSKMNISPWRILTKERKRVSLWSLLFWPHVGSVPLLSVSVADGIDVCNRQISPMYEYLSLINISTRWFFPLKPCSFASQTAKGNHGNRIIHSARKRYNDRWYILLFLINSDAAAAPLLH